MDLNASGLIGGRDAHAAAIKQRASWTSVNCSKLMDVFYDFFMAFLCMVDVVSDAMILYEFYTSGEWTFFALSLTVFCIAQIAYTVLFVAMYVRNYDDSYDVRKALWFLCVLPFGQLVPILICIQSYRLPLVDRIFRAFNLDPEVRVSTNDDPLKQYIMKKLYTQGGFLVESVLESIPQSIIQFIYLLNTTNNNTWLNIFSIFASMTSMASKGYLFSYSIDVPTFIFNCGSFIVDVFCIFAGAGWLFYQPSSAPTFTFIHEAVQLSLPSLVWCWKTTVVCCSILFLGVLLAIFGLLTLIERRLEGRASDWTYDSWGRRIKKLFAAFAGICFLALLYLPALVVVEGIKFSFFPLFVSSTLDSNHANKPGFYKRVFSFLRAADEDEREFIRRLTVVNRYLSRQFLQQYPMADDVVVTPDNRYDVFCHHVAKKLIAMDGERCSLAEVRHASGLSISSLVATYLDFLRDEIARSRRRWGTRSIPLGSIGEILCYAYGLYILIPILSLSALYSALFPLLSLAQFLAYQGWDPSDGRGIVLQLTLTFIYMALLIIMAILARDVYRFKRCTLHVSMFNLHYSANAMTWPSEIELIYEADARKKLARKILYDDLLLPAVMADMMVSYLPTGEQAASSPLFGKRYDDELQPSRHSRLPYRTAHSLSYPIADTYDLDDFPASIVSPPPAHHQIVVSLDDTDIPITPPPHAVAMRNALDALNARSAGQLLSQPVFNRLRQPTIG